MNETKLQANGSALEAALFLVADFGGTNARAALTHWGPRGFSISFAESGVLSNGQTPAQWLSAFYQKAGRPRIAGCAACAAGPLTEDGNDRVIRFTNRNSEVRASQLADACGLPQSTLINDFEAVAHAVDALQRFDLREIGNHRKAPQIERMPQLVLGPGTGLGVALRVPAGEGTIIVPTEGGHAALAPFDSETLALWPILADGRGGQLSAEDVFSGPGLKRLYLACSKLDALQADDRLSAIEVSRLGLEGKNRSCATAVAIFTRWLGNYAGSLALLTGARGGVYVGGGILPSWGARFDSKAFREAFDRRATMQHYLRAIPVFLMTLPEPALAGLTIVAYRSAAPAPAPAPRFLTEVIPEI